MPDAPDGIFDCPISFLPVTDIQTRKEWKKHVFNDLRPYVYTTKACTRATVLFTHSRVWAEHEASHSEPESLSSEWCFCSALYQVKGPSYFKHVSAHLREISLSVLPQQVDDDYESDSNDGDLLSTSTSSLASRLSKEANDGERSMGQHRISLADPSALWRPRNLVSVRPNSCLGLFLSN
ncbi:hypothetical protein MFIFM68171_08274 [Madurella fahalii]|uniref:Oxidoreductase acuF-like C2H2 type zinc-finger domain-containing protein n=1 Tax=Madurella fahalii TaxID=1157608 RepID=A0ABQ0GJY8_9PEZI